MIGITGKRTAPCARTLTRLAIPLLTAFIAGCAAATGGGTDGTGVPVSDPGPPPAAAPTNTPPVVSAGTDITIELPTDSATLSGSATDDGLPDSALTYQWEWLSGPSGPLN